MITTDLRDMEEAREYERMLIEKVKDEERHIREMEDNVKECERMLTEKVKEEERLIKEMEEQVREEENIHRQIDGGRKRNHGNEKRCKRDVEK